jgi:hypothetical protein
MTWMLSELKSVDGKNVSSVSRNLEVLRMQTVIAVTDKVNVMINFVLSFQDTHEFDLHFDKVFKWFAINLQERQHFLVVLWKVGHYFM